MVCIDLPMRLGFREAQRCGNGRIDKHDPALVIKADDPVIDRTQDQAAALFEDSEVFACLAQGDLLFLKFCGLRFKLVGLALCFLEQRMGFYVAFENL